MDGALDILVRRYGVAQMAGRRQYLDGRVERSRRLRERGGSMIAPTFTPEQTGDLRTALMGVKRLLWNRHRPSGEIQYKERVL